MDKQKYGYHDMKVFETRVANETKKITELISAVDKIKTQTSLDQKTFCVEFKKALLQYSGAPAVHTARYKAIIDKFCAQLDNLDHAYTTLIKHLTDVPSNALGQLPKKFIALKMLIKNGEKEPKAFGKGMDFEWERIETTKLSLLHIFNAQMFLHARSLEIYSETYEALQQLSFEAEFSGEDKNQLKEILKEKNIGMQQPVEPEKTPAQRSRSEAPRR